VLGGAPKPSFQSPSIGYIASAGIGKGRLIGPALTDISDVIQTGPPTPRRRAENVTTSNTLVIRYFRSNETDAMRIFDGFLPPRGRIPSSRYHSAIPFYYSRVVFYVIVCRIIPRNLHSRDDGVTRDRVILSRRVSRAIETRSVSRELKKRSRFAFDRLKARSLRQSPYYTKFSISSFRFPTRIAPNEKRVYVAQRTFDREEQ